MLAFSLVSMYRSHTTVSSRVPHKSHFSLTPGKSFLLTHTHEPHFLTMINMLEVIFPSAFPSLHHLPSPSTLGASALFTLGETEACFSSCVLLRPPPLPPPPSSPCCREIPSSRSGKGAPGLSPHTLCCSNTMFD